VPQPRSSIRSKTGEAQFDQALPEQQGHMIAKILDQHLVEDFGMLVKQGGHVGFGRAHGDLAALHRGEPYCGTAVIIGIKRENFGIGRGGEIEITRFLQRKCAIVGFRQSVIVCPGHGRLQIWFRAPFYTKARSRQAANGPASA
jgi:hypothetical protein